MKYIVVFHSDLEIVEAPESAVFLGDFQSFTMDDWKKLDPSAIVEAKVFYGGEIFDATVLQVILHDDYDTTAAIRWLRNCRFEKNCKIPSLIRIVERVADGRRQRFAPLQSIQTESESESAPAVLMQTAEAAQETRKIQSRSAAAAPPPLLPLPSPAVNASILSQSVLATSSVTPKTTAAAALVSDTPMSANQATSFLNFGSQCLADLKAAMEAKAEVNLLTPEGNCFLQLSLLRQGTVIQQDMRRMEQRMLRLEQQQAFRFPMDVPEATQWNPVDSWEEYIALVRSTELKKALASQLVFCKSDNLGLTIRRMLSKCLSTQMQTVVNYSGRDMHNRSNSELTDKELGFKAAILPVFQDAITQMYGRNDRPTERDVEKCVIAALKYAIDRDGGRKRRRDSSATSQHRANADHRDPGSSKKQHLSKPASSAASRRRISSSNSDSDSDF